MKKIIFILILTSFYFPRYSNAQPGFDDPLFNSGDIGFGHGDGTNDYVNAVAIQNDGKVVIVGRFTYCNGKARRCIARLNSNGSLDTTFNPGSGVYSIFTPEVHAVATQNDGKIIIGGNFTAYDGHWGYDLARINTDGSYDTTFHSGFGTNTPVFSIAIQPSDGKILITGPFNSYDQTPKNVFARLNTNGSLDTTFSHGILSVNNARNTIIVQNDGKILLGGSFDINNNSRYIARFNTDGTVDNSFMPYTGGGVSSMALQPDGKIVAATGAQGLTRFNTNGIIDNTLNVGGTGPNSPITSVLVQPDNKIIISGGFWWFNGNPQNMIARLDNDGTLDTTFNIGTGANGTILKTARQNDGKIIIAGGNTSFWSPFTSFNGITRRCIARLNTDGSLDDFCGGTAVSGLSPIINSIVIQNDGKIIIGGRLTHYDGVPNKSIARLNYNGNLDNSFNTYLSGGADSSVNTISLQNDGKIIIGGNFTFCNYTSRGNIARIFSNGNVDSTFNPGSGTNGVIYSSAIQNDGKIIIGGFFSIYNGSTRNSIARINTNGLLDLSFVAGINGDVNTVSIQSDGKVIIGGSFPTHIARLNTNGTTDNTFNMGAGANGIVYITTIMTNGKTLIGGSFTAFNGDTVSNIALLNTNGTLDTTFNYLGLGANSTVRSITIQNDGKIIIGGDFTSYNGIPCNSLARLNSNGTLDNTFNMGGTGTYGIHTVRLQPDEKILIGGEFIHYNGVGRNRIARVLNDNMITGSDELIIQSEYFFYPNPATDELTIENSDLRIEKIELYNTIGENVFQSHVSNLKSQISIDVSQLLPGIYFITVTDQAGNKVTKKVVKM